MSPWVDVSMSNSKIKDFEEKDPLLPLNGLIATGKQFAGSLDTQNPLISPIYGNMDNLKEIFLIFGTNEILYPDCLKLEKLLKTSKLKSVTFIDIYINTITIIVIKGVFDLGLKTTLPLSKVIFSFGNIVSNIFFILFSSYK